MKISFIYHSVTGNTKNQAMPGGDGVSLVADIEVKTMSIDAPDNHWIEESVTVIFGYPTYED
jgi:hypothetical protein